MFIFFFIIIISVLLFLYILKSPIRGIYLVTFFLPFEYLGALDFAGVTVRISQVLALLTIIAWSVKKINRRDFSWARNPIALPIFFFLAVNALALSGAPNFSRSVAVFLFITFTVFFGFLIPNVARGSQELKNIIKILLGSAFLVSLFGLYQFAGDMVGLPLNFTGLRPQYSKEILGFTRVQGTALEPLYFANFLILPLSFLAAGLLSKNRFFKNKFLEWTILLAAGTAFILTVSRGAYAALVAALLIIFIFYRKKIWQKKFFIPTAATVLLIFLFSGIFLTGNLENFTNHLKDSFAGAAYKERVETFSLALGAWREHPWLGIGPGSFGPWVEMNNFIFPQAGGGWRIVNNLYLELLAESGVFGLAFFAAALLILFTRQFKSIKRAAGIYHPLAVALLAALVGIFIQYNTFSVIYIMHVWFLIGLAITVQNLVLVKK